MKSEMLNAYPEMSAGQYYPMRMPSVAVSLLHRVRIRMFGMSKVGLDEVHFSAPTTIWLSECRACGAWNVDYIHGFWPNEYFNCKPCMAQKEA